MILPGKRQYLLESNLSILIVILAAVCDVLYPHLVLYLVFLGFVPSIALIALFFRPLSYASQASFFKKTVSSFLIILLQLFFILFSFAFIFCLLKSFLIPHDAATQVNQPLLVSLLKKTAWLQPLSWVALVAAALHYCRYTLKKPAQFNILFASIAKKHTNEGIQLLIAHYISLATTLLYCLFSILVILFLTFYIGMLCHIKPISGITLEVLFFIPLLIYPLQTKYFSRLMRVMSQKCFPVPAYFLLIITYLVVFTIFFSYLTYLYKQLIPGSLLPNLKAHIDLIDFHNAVLIFAFSWFVISAPLQGSLIARLGKSLSTRSLIIASGIIPSLILYVFYFYYHHDFIVNLLAMNMPLLRILVLLTVLVFFLGQIKLHTLQVFEIGFSETMLNQTYKPLNYVMRPLLLTVIISYFIYVLNGIIFLHVLSFMLAFPVMLIFVFLGPLLLTSDW